MIVPQILEVRFTVVWPGAHDLSGAAYRIMERNAANTIAAAH